MGTPSHAVMQELRATLWERVGPETLQAVADLAALVAEIAADPDSTALHERGVALAHSVAGSAGMYGFRDEARAAVDLESLFRAWPGAHATARARTLVDQLVDGFGASE